MGNIVIVGGGISGLIYALFASEKFPDASVYVIEKEASAGGLLRAFDYGKHGYFDYGMHNFLETGSAELDEVIFNLLPEEEWQILSGNKRDLAGVFCNNNLQTHTPYIDLRGLGNEKYNECISDFFIHLDKTSKRPQESMAQELNAYSFFTQRFGKKIAEYTLLPAIEKIHKMSSHDLDYMATIFTPMTRVAMFDEPLVRELTNTKILRDYIAYVDQRNLPLERSSGRSGFYPKKYGVYRVIAALVEKLKTAKVQILNETSLSKIEYNKSGVTELTFNKGEETLKLGDIKKVVWTSNIPLLGKLLNLSFTGLKYDKPLKTIVVNFLLSKPLKMDGLYYFFCYDKDFHTYRVTDFTAYCEGAPRDGTFPVSLELLIDEEHLRSISSVEELAEKELFKFGITEEGTRVVFSKAEVLDSGFPRPTCNNIFAVKNIRQQIRQLDIKNLDLLGVLSEDNLFFQTDVLMDTFRKAKKL